MIQKSLLLFAALSLSSIAMAADARIYGQFYSTVERTCTDTMIHAGQIGLMTVKIHPSRGFNGLQKLVEIFVSHEEVAMNPEKTGQFVVIAANARGQTLYRDSAKTIALIVDEATGHAKLSLRSPNGKTESTPMFCR